MRSQGGRSRSSTPHDDQSDTTSPGRRHRFQQKNKENQGSGSRDRRRWTADEFDDDLSPNEEDTTTRRTLSAEPSTLGQTLMSPSSDSMQDSTYISVGGEASRSDGMLLGGIEDQSVDDSCKVVSPPVPQQQLTRRVSFADDENNEKSPPSRKRLSSLVDWTEDLLLGPRARRRSSNFERRQYALELVRAAHELMFTDTRPDGLRPITGIPMMDGQGLGSGGGVYVGLAGLKGFDFSFVGATANNNPDGLGSMPRSLSRPSVRASSSPDASGATIGSAAPGSPSATSASNLDASWLEQGSLLDRAPGTLMPRERGRNDSPVGNRRECTGRLQAADEPDRSIGGVPTAELSHPGGPPGETKNTEDPTRINGGHSEEKEIIGREADSGESTALGQQETSGGDELGVSMVERAVASLFTPKAAVLWSAANVSVDDLVLSAAPKRGNEVSQNI